MKTYLISFAAVALLASGCIGEHDLEQEAEDGIDTDDEQLTAEQLEGEEATARAEVNAFVTRGTR